MAVQQLDMIKILNYKTDTPETNDAINIMRPNPLGNPYKTTMYTRKKAIDLFRQHIELEFKKGYGEAYEQLVEIKRRVSEGKDVELICCCKPSPCHGDIIAQFIENLLIEEAFSF